MGGKALVMGIDGATWRVLLPWIKEGKLKNFKRIYDSGTSCDFLSTFPVLTPAAWTSIITGKNPGKHGIYHFLDIDREYSPRIFSSKDVKSKDMFSIVGAHGKRCASINIPFTYPPKGINGVQVSCMLTPGLDADFVRPRSYRDKIIKAVPDYIFEINYSQYVGRKREFLEKIIDVTHKRFKLITYLLNDEIWDLFFFVLVGADRLQHHMMNDPDSLLQYYSCVDKYLGNLIKESKEDVNIFIVSDHGFKPVDKEIYITHQFLKEGWIRMTYRQKILSRSLHLFKWLFGESFLPKLILLYKKYRKNLVGVDTHNTINVPFKNDFWKNSKAFPFGTSIYINDKERFKWGTIKDRESFAGVIRTGLKNLKDPTTGKNIIDEVLLSKDIFSGPFTKYAPDVCFEACEGYRVSPNLFQNSELITKSKVLNGDHEINGVFLAYGPDISVNKRIKPISVYDFAPTVLHLMGLPVGSDMDGKVVKEIFKKTSPAFTDKVRFVSDTADEKSKINDLFNISGVNI